MTLPKSLPRRHRALLVAAVSLALLPAFSLPSQAAGRATFEDWRARQRAAGASVTTGAIEEHADDVITVRDLVIEPPAVPGARHWRLTVPVATLTGFAPGPHSGWAAAHLSISGIRLEIGTEATFELGAVEGSDIAVPDFGDIAIDPDRRIATEVAVLNRAAELRIGHLELGRSTARIDMFGSPVTIDFAGLTIDGIAAGRAERVAAGRLALDVRRPEGPIAAQVGSIQIEGYDYGFYAAALDDDTYGTGPLDRSWHEIQRRSVVTEMTLSAAGVNVSIASARSDGTRMRRLEKPIGRAIDRVFASKDADGDALLLEGQLLSAFAINGYRIDGITVDSGKAVRARIEAVGLSGLSPDGLETLFLEGFGLSAEGSSLAVQRFVLGDLAFPSYVEFLRALKTALSKGGSFDAAALLPRLGHAELTGFKGEDPDSGAMTLGSVVLDLGQYVGAVPTTVKATIGGLSIPATAFHDPQHRSVLKGLGYDRLDLAARLSAAWHADAETITIDDLGLSLDNGAALGMTMVLAGADRALFETFDPAAFASLSLASLKLNYADGGLFRRAVAHFARANQLQPSDVRARINAVLAGLPALFADAGRAASFRDALARFVREPGRLELTAHPTSPVPVVAVVLAARIGKPPIGDILDLELSAAP